MNVWETLGVFQLFLTWEENRRRCFHSWRLLVVLHLEVLYRLTVSHTVKSTALVWLSHQIHFQTKISVCMQAFENHLKIGDRLLSHWQKTSLLFSFCFRCDSLTSETSWNTRNSRKQHGGQWKSMIGSSLISFTLASHSGVVRVGLKKTYDPNLCAHECHFFSTADRTWCW